MLMTARQVADHTGVCIRTIYRMKDRGELPYYQIGRQIRFKLEEVEETTKCQKRQNGAP
jgi:excisionase family DNA binding protein